MQSLYKIDPYNPDEAVLQATAALLRPGALIIYPTETFYALGAPYNDAESLEKIFTLKCRLRSQPLPLIIETFGFLYTVAESVPPAARKIADAFWPGPVTVLLKASASLHHLLTAASGKIGCRIPGCPAARRLLAHLHHPLTATSANISGGTSPTRIDQIPESLRAAVDVILDAGSTPGGSPSTVIDITSPPYTAVREGAVPLSAILNCLA